MYARLIIPVVNSKIHKVCMYKQTTTCTLLSMYVCGPQCGACGCYGAHQAFWSPCIFTEREQRVVAWRWRQQHLACCEQNAAAAVPIPQAHSALHGRRSMCSGGGALPHCRRLQWRKTSLPPRAAPPHTCSATHATAWCSQISHKLSKGMKRSRTNTTQYLHYSIACF